MQRGKDAPRGLQVLHKFSRGRKLVGLVPRLNAPSDVEDSSSDEEVFEQLRRNSTSSEAPSIDSSLERLNLLEEDSDEEVNLSQSEDSFISRVVRDVGNGETSYEKIPSLSSIPSLETLNSPSRRSESVDSPPAIPAPTVQSPLKLAEPLPVVPSLEKSLSAMPKPAEPSLAVVSPLTRVPKTRSKGKAAVPSPSVPSPAVPSPSMRSPAVHLPSVPSPAVPSPSMRSPAVPLPSVPSPVVPSPSMRSPAVPLPSVPSPVVPSPSMRSPAVPLPSVPSPSLPSPAVQDMSRVPRTRSKRKADTTVTKVTTKKRKIEDPVNYNWKKGKLKSKADIENEEYIFPMDKSSPLDYFGKYFSTDLLQDIVTNTNLYSVQCTGKSMNFTEDDLKDFISIMLIMGIVVMPAYTDYWATKTRYSEVADVMSLKKYEQIRRYIHFVDNSCVNSDRYFKVRPLVEKVRQNCLKTEEEMRYSVDEMTIPYKGNKAGNRKQYNPMKPDKWGFKCIVRAGMSGIVYDFLLYGGEDTFRFIHFSQTEERLTLGARMVIALSTTILTPACVVYFDNYFATLDLARHLRDTYGIFSLGTIRQNRLKGCGSLLMNDKDMKKKGRGTFSQVVDEKNNLAVVKWFDNKVVTLVSSYTDAYPVETIKRYSKEEKRKIDVECPQLVKHYNQHMGGVDLSDMLIALYRTTSKVVVGIQGYLPKCWTFV